MDKVIAVMSFICLIVVTMKSQNTLNSRLYKKEEEMLRFDSLNLKYGKNKNLPAGYELQALIALSYYPELSDESIDFVFKNKKLPYSSRPQLKTLINIFEKKKYTIIISDKSIELREPSLLKNLNFNAQIGALGHELAHTAYYTKTNRLKIIFEGVKYLNGTFKEKFEKMTDAIAIEHGLGLQIYEWSKSVYPIKTIDGNRGKIYYSPEDILKILNTKH